MTKREAKLLTEIIIGLAWRIPIGIFAYLGFVNWWFDVIVG